MGFIVLPSATPPERLGEAGRFTLYAHEKLPLSIQVVDSNSTSTIKLSDLREFYPGIAEGLFRAKALIPHADGTFTVVSVGGVVSRWRCEKGEQGSDRVLESVRITEIERVLQVALLTGHIFIMATKGLEKSLYSYFEGILKNVTPSFPFNEIEASDSSLILKEGDQEVGNLTIERSPAAKMRRIEA